MSEIAAQLRALLGANRRYWFLIDSSAALLGIALDFIDRNLWSPAEAYLLVLALIISDFVTGFWLAVRQNRVETRRALRVVYALTAYSGLLFFAHNLARHEPALSWLPKSVFFPMALILFASLIKNLSLLGLIPKQLADFLYQRLDLHKNPKPPES